MNDRQRGFVPGYGHVIARLDDVPEPQPPRPPHVHRWLPAGLVHSGTMVVQSCECGVVRTVKVPG